MNLRQDRVLRLLELKESVNCTIAEEMIVIIIVNKLRGKAYKWFHTKA